MNVHLLQRLVLARFWVALMRVAGAVWLFWAFGLGVRFFIRQEPFFWEALGLAALATLPAILPYLACLAGQMMVIELGEKNEWQLSALLGLDRDRRFALCRLALVALGLTMVLYEGFLRPWAKERLHRPASYLPVGEIRAPLGGTAGIEAEGWIFHTEHNGGGIVLLRDLGERTFFAEAARAFVEHTGAGARVRLEQGRLWPRIGADSPVGFRELALQLDQPAALSEDELDLLGLARAAIRGSGKASHMLQLLMRDALAPWILFSLGIACGYFALAAGKGRAYALSLFGLLFVYYPLCILSRNPPESPGTVATALIYLPLLGTWCVGRGLNIWAARRGVA